MTGERTAAADRGPARERPGSGCDDGAAAEDDGPVRVRVDYDFASTLCYVAHRCMQRLAPRLAAEGVALHWSPLDLARLAGWRRGAPLAPPRRENAHRVARELGVVVRTPEVWPDSRDAHAVALCLDPAREAAWRERVFSAVHEEGRALDDVLVRRLAAESELGLAPLGPEGLAAAREELERRTRAAAARDVTGVPNFMLGGWPFGGIQTDDTMLSLLGRFARRERARRRESRRGNAP